MAKWTKSVLGIFKYITKKNYVTTVEAEFYFFSYISTLLLSGFMKMVLTKELEVNKTSVKFRQKQKKRRLKYSRCLFFCHSNQGSNVLHMVDLPSTWGSISTLLTEDKHVRKESLLCFYPNKLKTILIYTMTYHSFFFLPSVFSSVPSKSILNILFSLNQWFPLNAQASELLISTELHIMQQRMSIQDFWK